ncbi:MAG: flavin reductase family protein [Thermodesulfobacteriota bacterium]
MSRVRIEPQVHLPMPVVLVGAMVEGRANFMPAGWVCRANYRPPMLAVGIGHAKWTAKGVREAGAFSVNLPRADMVDTVDYCGIVTGRSTDKSTVFPAFAGDLGAPLIADCPLALECRLEHVLELPSNYLFVGEITGAWAEEGALKDGAPDPKKLDPLFLTMPDNTYWRLGPALAKAWACGKAVKERM